MSTNSKVVITTETEESQNLKKWFKNNQNDINMPQIQNQKNQNNTN